jgi:hypothetical protein
MNVVNQVRVTNDYNLFTKLIGNRVVNKLHINRLKNSFQKNYLLCPIIVNEKYQIVDGQHRFEAAKQLNLPINFIKVNGYGLEEVQALNTNMKNWKKEDYLYAYIDLGYPEYIKFKNFMDDYPDFGIGSCEVLLANRSNGASKGSKKKEYKSENNKDGHFVRRYFQEGQLEIEDYDLAVENAEKILMIKPFYDGFYRTVFVRTMVALFKHPDYNHSKFIQRLSANPGFMQHCSNITQYKIMIEEIFNFRSRNKVSLRY